MRIVLLIPFYGVWPPFMHPYLESCRRNPIFDVTFVTDLQPFPRSPPNVRYVHLPFEALKARLHALFGIDTSAMRPYKMCDFRPAYGVIFEDVVGKADFWGYGDNDMVLGSVGNVITAERLANYDLLSFKRGHLQGPLTIYRNRADVNELFREGGEFRRIFADPTYLSFDEFGPGVFYTKIRRSEDLASLPLDNISVIAFNGARKGALRVYAEQHGKEDLRHGEILVYDDGRIVDVTSGAEYLFYHWVLEKRALWFNYPAWFVDRPRRFYISTTGFYSAAEFRWYWLRHSWRLARGASRWAALRVMNYLRRRTGRRVLVDTYPRVGWVKRREADA